jgi:hypothetical protein
MWMFFMSTIDIAIRPMTTTNTKQCLFLMSRIEMHMRRWILFIYLFVEYIADNRCSKFHRSNMFDWRFVHEHYSRRMCHLFEQYPSSSHTNDSHWIRTWFHRLIRICHVDLDRNFGRRQKRKKEKQRRRRAMNRSICISIYLVIEQESDRFSSEN